MRIQNYPIEGLRPTQFSLGHLEIEVKTAQLRGLKEKELSAYVEKALFWGVKDRNEVVHLIDGHHKVRSLMNLDFKTLTISLAGDYSNLSEELFWEKMQKNDFIYLFDHEGKPSGIESLPLSFCQLKDDPFRSLAWFVRKNKVYAKDDKPFQEFEWANYLRNALGNIDISSLTSINANSASIIEALYTEEALKLRGHRGSQKKIKEIKTSLY